MTKYNEFAKKLDEAFKSARAEYKTLVDRISTANAANEAALRKHVDPRYSGELDAERAQAKADLLSAKNKLETEGNRIWEIFNQRKKELTAELRTAVKANDRVNPDAVDGNGLELLKSGVLTATDMEDLVEHYDDNPIMLKLLGKYALDAANGTQDEKERVHFAAIHRTVKDGACKASRDWDNLLEVVDRCSGQSRNGMPQSPDFICRMNEHWDSLSADAVNNF